MKLMGYSVSPNNAKLPVGGLCLMLSPEEKLRKHQDFVLSTLDKVIIAIIFFFIGFLLG
jgi:hypothetical protein